MIWKTIQSLGAKLPLFNRKKIELIRLIHRAHQGQISIEELTNAKAARGRRADWVAVVAEILLDLKQQRAERAALEQEIRDRIANRTDALERKIGSLQVQAARDALTGLGNRRALDADLQKIIDTCQSTGTDACLLMIDVDHFKPLNDTLGHAAGDQLLREIGQLIRSNLRAEDHAYRAGGDEFVILMPGANLAAGMTLSARLGSLVTGLTRSLAVTLPPQLSIGSCALTELKEPTAKELLHTADSRLYAVKALRPRTRKSA
jgi:diguanylate cyclase (GGDEF)-like protein